MSGVPELGGELMSRRILLDNEDRGNTYSGVITFDERPAEAVSFECPGCTRFAIMPQNVEITSGNWGALFIGITAIKDGYTSIVKTYESGIGGFTCVGYTDKQYAGKSPIVSFTETGVTMEIKQYSESNYAWFGGFSYAWIAW